MLKADPDPIFNQFLKHWNTDLINRKQFFNQEPMRIRYALTFEVDVDF